MLILILTQPHRTRVSYVPVRLWHLPAPTPPRACDRCPPLVQLASETAVMTVLLSLRATTGFARLRREPATTRHVGCRTACVQVPRIVCEGSAGLLFAGRPQTAVGERDHRLRPRQRAAGLPHRQLAAGAAGGGAGGPASRGLLRVGSCHLPSAAGLLNPAPGSGWWQTEADGSIWKMLFILDGVDDF